MTTAVGMAILVVPGGRLPAAEHSPSANESAPSTQPVIPKPLSAPVNKGLAWLAKHQQPDGGWSQGESSQAEYREGEVGDKSNVADSCMAALALLRAGSTPSTGDYAWNITKAVGFVCGQVEKASQDGLFITDIHGTRVQTKLGQYVDTFAAALLLAQVKDRMPDVAGCQRVAAALDKTLAKIQKNQKEDGRWADEHDGWASVLCQSVATKAVNMAAQRGAAVDRVVVARAQEFASRSQTAIDAPPAATPASGGFAARGGGFGGGGGSFGGGAAGVELYARSASLGAFQSSANTDANRIKDLTKQHDDARDNAQKAQKQYAVAATQPTTQPKQLAALKHDVDQANRQLSEIDGQFASIRRNEAALKSAQSEVIDRMNDKDFVAGFGSNGGEEFLSYMNIGESLALKGGEPFTKWDKAMTGNLNRIQNDDGSWSGQHCITGRTFCTAAALMVLTVDRSPAEVLSQPLKGSK